MNWSWWISENDIFIPSNSSGPTYVSIGYQTCVASADPLLNSSVVSAACSLRLVMLGMFALVYPSTFFCCLCTCVQITLSQHMVYPSTFFCCLGTCVPKVLRQHFGSLLFILCFWKSEVKIWKWPLQFFFLISKVWKVRACPVISDTKWKFKKNVVAC